MLRGKSLSGDEAERVRIALADVVRQAGTQTAAAKRLDVTQQTISDVLKGKAAGVGLARRVADALSISLDDLLAGRAASSPAEGDRYPERAIAADLARRGGIDLEAIRLVQGIDAKGEEHTSRWQWLDDMRAQERDLKRKRADPRIQEEEDARAKAATARRLAEERESNRLRDELLKRPKK